MRYFGPYAHAWAIRETVDLLLRVFPMRSCTNGVFKRSAQIGRPCLLGYIGKCSAPCVGRVDAEEHRAIVEDFCDFMGAPDPGSSAHRERDVRTPRRQDYEQAARLRDEPSAPCEPGHWRNAGVVLGDGTDADVVALAEDPLEAAVQVFHVRGGRVRGQRGWVAETSSDANTG